MGKKEKEMITIRCRSCNNITKIDKEVIKSTGVHNYRCPKCFNTSSFFEKIFEEIDPSKSKKAEKGVPKETEEAFMNLMQEIRLWETEWKEHFKGVTKTPPMDSPAFVEKLNTKYDLIQVSKS